MMKWTFAAVVVSLGALVACSSGGSSGSGGGGGEGGDDWGGNGGNGGGKTTSAASAAGGSGGMGGMGGSSSSSGSGGGGSACDMAGSTCQTCQQCTQMQGGCQAEVMACQNDAACVALAQCLQACADATCQQNCAMTNQAGVQPYNAVAVCLICKSCPTACAQQAGMCPP